MHTIKAVTLNVLLAFSAGGCASLGSDTAPQALRVQPSSGITMGGPAALLNYQLGRYHHSRLEYDRATASYLVALNADPTHVGARNGLAIVAAMQGRLDDAARELRAAIVLSPDQAHLHNNLGYVHMLRGAPAEAAAEFSIATRLEPGNAKAAANLALAQTKAGLANTGAATIAAPAPSPAPAQVAAPVTVTPAQPVVEPESRLLSVSRQVYELKAQSRPPAPATVVMPASAPLIASVIAPAAARSPGSVAMLRPAMPAAGIAVSAVHTPASAVRAALPSSAPLPIRLEVANGNGLNGFAKTVSRWLFAGTQAIRLTNQLPYTQAATEIQYRPGRQDAAAELAARLRPDIPMTMSSTLPGGTDVRLVLGRDAWTTTALMRNVQPADQPLQIAGRQ